MGQIVNRGNVTAVVNLLAILTVAQNSNLTQDGSKASTVLANGEIWLIDTTNSKSGNGDGKYDSYIVGNGNSMASALTILEINEKIIVDNSVAQGSTNAVSGGAVYSAIGGKQDALANSEDVVKVTGENGTSLNFADKVYNNAAFSGLGRVYLRKNIVNEATLSSVDITDSEYFHSGHYVKLFPQPGDTEHLITYVGSDDAPGSDTDSVSVFPSMGFYQIPVTAGDKIIVTATCCDIISHSIAWYSRYWSLTDANGLVKTCYKPNNENYDNVGRVETAIIDVTPDLIPEGQTGYLWINTIIYDNAGRHVEKTVPGSPATYNKLSASHFQSVNTIYYIQYDYDFNKEMIELPENSVLMFVGGSIKNAYLKGNNTSIVASSSSQIFDTSTHLVGTWNNVDFYPKWFGAACDGVTDDTAVLQKILKLAKDIDSKVICDLQGKTYKTTSGLIFVSNTSIKNGKILAKFSNQMDWILQTYTVYRDLTQVEYYKLAAWQEHDNSIISRVSDCFIQDITIEGELNETTREVIDSDTQETTTETIYTPIYGGLKIQSTGSVNCTNVIIQNVGIGLARGTCLQTYDENMDIRAYFTAFAAFAVNGHSLRDSYLNAHCHILKTSASDNKKVIPYGTEYQNFTVNVGRAHYKGAYIEGNGGIDDSDETYTRPMFCSIKALCGYSLTFDNIIVDTYCDVAVAAYQSNIVIRSPWWEGIAKCFLYGVESRMTIDMATAGDSSNPDYDFIGQASVFTLSNCYGRIMGSGGTDGETHKCDCPSDCMINVLNRNIPYGNKEYPNLGIFSFLRADREVKYTAGNNVTINDNVISSTQKDTTEIENNIASNSAKIAVIEAVIIPHFEVTELHSGTSGTTSVINVISAAGLSWTADADSDLTISVDTTNSTVSVTVPATSYYVEKVYHAYIKYGDIVTSTLTVTQDALDMVVIPSLDNGVLTLAPAIEGATSGTASFTASMNNDELTLTSGGSSTVDFDGTDVNITNN